MTRARSIGCLLVGWLMAADAHAESWIAVATRGGTLTFPAVVEGTETTAALDTSAPLDSIDAAFAQRIGLTLSGRRQRVASAYSASALVASEAQLDVELFGAKLVLRDTPALQHPATPLRLGAAFLEPFVLQIDYPGSRIRLLPRKALDLRGHDNVALRAAEGSCTRHRSRFSSDVGSGVNDFSRADFPRRGGHAAMPCLPTVRVEFPGGKELWLLLDTGGFGPVVVSRSVAKREGWLETGQARGVETIDVFGNRIAVDLLVLPSLRIGPFELGDVPVAVPAEGERVFSGGESWARVETGTHVTRGARANGRIGYDALRHFVVTIDLKRELMRVAQPAQPGSERVGAPD